MKRILLLIITLAPLLGLCAQTEITSTAAKNLYKTTSNRRVTVHDPSVVWEPSSKRYYIFGSHKAGAYTTDMQNWTQANPTWRTATSTNATNRLAFVTPQVTTITKKGEEVEFVNFNAVDWSGRSDSGYSVDGNMWAPDVIWNEKMQKWCMYLSINGDSWHSSIILLTADRITGPYLYQGPVVICGFYDTQHSYKDTDLELVVGKLNSLPSRYNVGNNWGRRWPHTIDPCVFYDEEGKLWMVYGSWSGGIWILRLNEETGLRDYDVTYASTGGTTDGVTSDPYFGKKLGGGYYVSGEAPYIGYIGGYYYLFITYGFLDSVGGYVMRVFRSEKPDGPYKDAAGNSAIFTSYKMNYGKNADNRGVKIIGAYDDWGYMSKGELAQGHNSVIAAPDGRTYLVYHTRFNDGTEGHQVRVHQLFQTKNGWLVAAPFEYNGETLTDTDMASTQSVPADQVPGTYQLLVHKYAIDYANREVVTPVKITLTTDGKVTGAYTGTWSLDEGTSYLTIKLGTVNYQGVVFEEQMDYRSVHSISFSALSTSGVNVWGYKLHPKYAVAWHVNNQTVPVRNFQRVSSDLDLYSMDRGDDNVTLQWTSSAPDLLSDEGRYTPVGLLADSTVTLTARVSSYPYYWTQSYTVTVLPDPTAVAAPLQPFVNTQPLFDLTGRRVTRPSQGLYIQNGRVLIKR